jgi:aminopeptidase N
MKLLATVSGKDMSQFMDQWVCNTGVPRLLATYTFVRKKNFIELKLRQDLTQNSDKFVVSLAWGGGANGSGDVSISRRSVRLVGVGISV